MEELAVVKMGKHTTHNSKKKKKDEARTSVFGPRRPVCVMVPLLASQNVKNLIVVVGGF